MIVEIVLSNIMDPIIQFLDCNLKGQYFCCYQLVHNLFLQNL